MPKVTDKELNKKARDVALQIEQLMAVVDFKFSIFFNSSINNIGSLCGNKFIIWFLVK